MDKETRNRIQHLTQEARRLLEAEYAEQLGGLYDILPKGTIGEAPGAHLDEAGQLLRSKLVEAIAHRLAGGESPAEAVDGYVRSVAFTTLNRFVALKMLEARGLAQECISRGEQSAGFREFAGLAPGLSQLPDHGYRLYIESVFDEIGREVQVLFDRLDPASLLWPRPQALERLLSILNTTELADIWAKDETIGWIYQYFNSKEERDEMRKASRSPQNTSEMAVRNQFFTPRYVVEFLTDNTLGRIWYEMRKGATSLKDVCRYLVRRPNEIFLNKGEAVPVDSGKTGHETAQLTADFSQEELLKKPVYIEHRPKKDPRDLRVLDPACGSGHFLLYAFDLLERILEEAWADTDSPKSEATGRTLREDFETLDELCRVAPKLIIEYNLHGIDIDPRAVQIAALALWLRAQKSWKNLEIKATERSRIARSNIVTAEPMPGEEDMRREFINGLKPRVLGQLVNEVFEKMKFAGEAGSLLKIEEEIRDAAAKANDEYRLQLRLKKEGVGYLPGLAPPHTPALFDFSDLSDQDFWKETEYLILEALKKYAEQAENGHAIRHRLFAEDTARGFAFIDLCRNRYDVILMNPPFGASSRGSKDYIEAKYPDTKGDVLANFIERSLLLADKQGRVGAISSRTPFFLGSFETLRTEVLGKIGYIRLMVDLGEGVLEAMVETAIYVMTKHRRGEPESLFFRLLIDSEKGELLKQLTDECFNAYASDRTFVINPRHFEKLSGNPYAYWVNESTLRKLGAHSSIEGKKCSIRVGLQTGNDFRYLRVLWEIPCVNLFPRFPIKGIQESIHNQCIEQSTKGGHWVPYSKTDFASPWFSPITLAVNWENDGNELRHFTDTKGKLRSRPQNESFYFRPGFSYMLRSTRLVPYLVPSGIMPTAGRSQTFPEPGQEYTVLGICASNLGSAIIRFRGGSFARPTIQAGMVQKIPACDFDEEILSNIEGHVNVEVNKRRAVAQRYEPFQEFVLPAWIRAVEGGETVWDLYSLFGRSLENKIAEAFGLSSGQLAELERDIREAVLIRGRQEDVELEDIGEASSEDEQELNLELIPETPEEKAFGLFAYTVGVVLGRWDIRLAIDPSMAPKLANPFDPLPVCPPGMLVGPDGLPAESGCIVSEEWLRGRPDANTLPVEGTVKNPTISDLDYPLSISWSGILVDDPGHPDDVMANIRHVYSVIWGDRAEDILREAAEILGSSPEDLRTWFRREFFTEHIKRYSKSRRKAPIYWELATPSHSYAVWLYYHRCNKDTLFKVLHDYVIPKLRHEAGKFDNLRMEAGPTPSAGQRKEIERQENFVAELRVFKDEVARVAPLWDPDLNDGVIINFAPLWQLVPQHRVWQKECKDCWDKLAAGDFDWSNLAMHLWPERVVPKCRTDISLAIAHKLVERLWEITEDTGKEKWNLKVISDDDLEGLIAERISPAVKTAIASFISTSSSPSIKRRRK